MYSAAVSFLLVPIRSLRAESSNTDLFALLALSTISRSSSSNILPLALIWPLAPGEFASLLVPMADLMDLEIFLDRGTSLT